MGVLQGPGEPIVSLAVLYLVSSSFICCSPIAVRATSQGGDLMSDLFTKLVMRRKGRHLVRAYLRRR